MRKNKADRQILQARAVQSAPVDGEEEQELEDVMQMHDNPDSPYSGGPDVIVFGASRTWRNRVLGKGGLSPRKVHPKRRPVVSEEDLQHFVLRIHKIIQLQPWTVMNMDETSWKSVDAHMRTIALRGAEEVTAFFDGDPKACVTAIATIDAAGGKLPLWVIAKGRTDRCEKRFRLRYDQAIEKRKLFVTHQDSGWTSRQVAFQYLNWLREQVQGPVVLIWDLFSAHRDGEVKAAAEKLGIRLEFIPPGMTGRVQPLDKRIFGNMKGQAKSRIEAQIVKHGDAACTIVASIDVLLQVWESLTQEDLLGAWDHFRGSDAICVKE